MLCSFGLALSSSSLCGWLFFFSTKVAPYAASQNQTVNSIQMFPISPSGQGSIDPIKDSLSMFLESLSTMFDLYC